MREMLWRIFNGRDAAVRFINELEVEAHQDVRNSRFVAITQAGDYITVWFWDKV